MLNESNRKKNVSKKKMCMPSSSAFGSDVCLYPIFVHIVISGNWFTPRRRNSSLVKTEAINGK